MLKVNPLSSAEVIQTSSMGGKNALGGLPVSVSTGYEQSAVSSTTQRVTMPPQIDSTIKKEALLCDFCHNNGTCVVNEQTKELQCVCAAGFGGTHCDIAIDVCLSLHQPCLNFGKCVSDDKLPERFRCQCPFGFTGSLCEMSNLLLVINCSYTNTLFNYLRSCSSRNSHL